MIFPFSTTSFLGLFFLAAIMYPAIFETKRIHQASYPHYAIHYNNSLYDVQN